MSELFIIRPQKYENESIEGYLCRLSVINHVPLKYIYNKPLIAKSSDKDIEEYFENLFKLTGYKYNKDQFLHEWSKNFLTLPGWKMAGNTRFCPHCLKDSLYHRFFWSLSTYTYCYKHQCYLMDRCDYCSKKIGIEETILGVCKKCNTMLAQNKILSSEFQEDILIRVSNVSSYFDPNVSTKDYMNVINLLSFYLDYKILKNNIPASQFTNFRMRGYLSDVKLQYEINSLAINLLEDWPYGITNYIRNTFQVSAIGIRDFLNLFISNVKHRPLRMEFRKDFKKCFAKRRGNLLGFGNITNEKFKRSMELNKD